MLSVAHVITAFEETIRGGFTRETFDEVTAWCVTGFNMDSPDQPMQGDMIKFVHDCIGEIESKSGVILDTAGVNEILRKLDLKETAQA